MSVLITADLQLIAEGKLERKTCDANTYNFVVEIEDASTSTVCATRSL